MTPPPPLPSPQDQADARHLNLLSIFHFVSAGFAVAGIAFLGLHFAMMRMFFENPEMWEQKGPNSISPEMVPTFFTIFEVFYVVMAVWFLASGILNVLSGFWIRSGKNRVGSMIVAGLNCLHFPFGTVLGVFTIVVLARDSVVRAYEGR